MDGRARPERSAGEAAFGEDEFRAGCVEWEVPVGCPSVIWRSEGRRRLEGHTGTRPPWGGPQRASLCRSDLACQLGCGGGPGSAHDSRVVWTLAGLRCLKHLSRVDPVLGCPRCPRRFSEDLAKIASAKAWPLEPLSSGQKGSWGLGALVPGRELGGGPRPLRNPGTAFWGRRASHQTDSLRHPPRPLAALGPRQGAASASGSVLSISTAGQPGPGLARCG